MVSLPTEDMPHSIGARFPAFLQQKSFWKIWALRLPLLPCGSKLSVGLLLSGHAGLPGNEFAGSLAKTGATLPYSHTTGPGHCKEKVCRYSIQTSLPRSHPSLVLLPKQDKTEGEFLPTDII